MSRFVPSVMRNRSAVGETMDMKRREENSVRVTNLSEDTREDDLKVRSALADGCASLLLQPGRTLLTADGRRCTRPLSMAPRRLKVPGLVCLPYHCSAHPVMGSVASCVLGKSAVCSCRRFCLTVKQCCFEYNCLPQCCHVG